MGKITSQKMMDHDIKTCILHRLVMDEYHQRSKIIKLIDGTERFGLWIDDLFKPSGKCLKLYNWRSGPSSGRKGFSPIHKYIWGPQMIACSKYYPFLNDQAKVPKNYWRIPRSQIRLAYKDRQRHQYFTRLLNNEFRRNLNTAYYYDYQHETERIEYFCFEENNRDRCFNYRDLNSPKPYDTNIWSLTKSLDQAICSLPENYYGFNQKEKSIKKLKTKIDF